MDPFGGLPVEPVTLQRYLYAAQNPVSLTDATGLDPDIGSLGLGDALLAMAVPNLRAVLFAVTGGGSPKTVTVDVVIAYGALAYPPADLQFANERVYRQANVVVKKGKEIRLNEEETKWALGGDVVLQEYAKVRYPTREEVRLFSFAPAGSDSVPVCYVGASSEGSTRGEAFPPSAGSGIVGFVVVTSQAGRATFSHELGHVLLDAPDGHVGDPTNVMYLVTSDKSTGLTPAQIPRIRMSPYAK